MYPNLPIFLPPKATERKIVLKKDGLTILGSVFTPPFTLSQLAEKLGPARIVLQNGTRKSPITGQESPYTQALALWDELGLQGWLDEDEQIIKTLGVRVAALGEYAVRQTFDGAVWIGSKDYREASWKDFAGFAHTLKLGGFTVYTRLPGPVSEEQSAQKAKLEALSAMVQISWKEPEQKAAKAQKYNFTTSIGIRHFLLFRYAPISSTMIQRISLCSSFLGVPSRMVAWNSVRWTVKSGYS